MPNRTNFLGPNFKCGGMLHFLFVLALALISFLVVLDVGWWVLLLLFFLDKTFVFLWVVILSQSFKLFDVRLNMKVSRFDRGGWSLLIWYFVVSVPIGFDQLVFSLRGSWWNALRLKLLLTAYFEIFVVGTLTSLKMSSVCFFIDRLCFTAVKLA